MFIFAQNYVAMSRIETKSLQLKNMNDCNYMLVHNRMYALSSDGSYRLCLTNTGAEISVIVTEDAFNSFIKYELSFSVMFMLYTTLCVKYGKVQIPF